MPLLNGRLNQGRAELEVALDVRASLREAALASGVQLPGPLKVPALIDTGADMTTVDTSVCASLQLQEVGEAVVLHPGTPPEGESALVYHVSLTVPHGGGLTVPLLRVLESRLAHTGHLVLIGNDVLDRCQFCRDGPNSEFSLEW